MSNILQYPRFREVEKLLVLHGFELSEFDSEQLSNIEKSIKLLRRERGFFCPTMLIAIVTLLNHHWRPDDLVALIPDKN
ncbi:hypothetical protein Q4574_11110 [Aliiglaciecola sp. 3_MG-2023]|uniref:hypothetical protein n=1 Tax=Aliiglaciecola sp. 3_MG-2023 TaxID=3062644 RepID=UPI0026E351F4|nr:hypothetical protein [Aliiglaciecola sp. 3_MG-2023]MDO6693838.1 hypothetical protein [Aliiglaciecola sp. 3_MG-2023]